MSPLSDTSNILQQERGGKRQRLEPLQEPATFQLIVERAGISGLISSSKTNSHSQLQTPEVDDPRQAKRQLTADLSTTAARETFLCSLSDALADEELLHRCLLPITVTVQVNFATGDSFMRMLLNMLPLQQQAATLLLQKLPEFSQTECDDTAAGNSGDTASTVPGLILGQLRWLEQVADEAGLTSTVLEVLPVCSPGIQQQLIGLLPEIMLPQDHEVVIETLQGLLDQDLSFMAPVLDCFSNMQLDSHLQGSVLSSLLGQLAAVEVDDLPGLVKYLISFADKANADKVLTVIRSGLHFVSASDPRLAIHDNKQKGAKFPKSKSPEALLVKELVSALQGNEAATAACLQLVGAITEPKSHRCFDFLVLLAVHAKAGSSRKSAEACLKKKLVDGHATPAWIHMSLQGHQVSLCDLWHSLLSLAQSWSRAREEPLTTASVQLYMDLFVGVDGSLERQQVLQNLHEHLGSGVAGEQDVALQALSVLAKQHRPLLSQYSSHLANILDHLETFTNSQLQQVFSMFAALTAVQPAQAAGGSSASSVGGPGGTRLQDELVITLNKALAQNSAGYKRIGVVGNLALLQQSAADYELMLSADGAAADQLLEEWMSRANAVFVQCQSHPGVLAFALDQWSELLERQAGPGGAFTMHMPKPMLVWLKEKANDLTNNAFLADLPRPEGSIQASEDGAIPGPQPDISLDDHNLEAKPWFNLDGSYSPVYVRLLPLAVSKDPSKRAQLVWLPACLRLMSACLQRTADDLCSIDALLGCPLALPDPAIITDGRWDGLPLSSKVGVLLSLMHAICWLREVVAVFAPDLNAALHKAAQGVSTQTTVDTVAETQNKLLMRLSQLRVLEALFKHLAATCPVAAQQLPDVSVPLLMGTVGQTLSVAPVAAAAGKQDQSGKLESELMSKLRCLRPAAAFALNVCPDPRKQLTTLLPVTHVVMDLACKLQLLVTRARRPAFAAPAATTPLLPQGLNGMGAIGGGLCSAATAGPPCLQSATLQQLVEQVVLQQYPALQRHLCTALTVIRQPPADDREELFNGLPGWIPTSIDASIYGYPSIAQATEAMSAAMQLALGCMQCFTLLLKCSKELKGQQVRQVLAALAAEPATAEDTVLLLRAAFKASRKFSCRSSGNSSLQLEVAVLSLLQAITAVAAAEGAPADTQDVMSKRLSMTAEDLLKCSWQQEDEAEEEHTTGFAWKGQTAPITQLLTVLISHAPDPSQQLLHLADDVLKEVPGKVPGKEALSPYGGYSALCSATLVTWYKVVFDQLVVCWEKLIARGQQLIPTAASTARGAKNTQQQRLNSQGMLDWDDEQVELMLTQAHRCCQAFSSLVQLTKPHHARKPLLAASVGQGGKFIEVLLKAMPLWRALYCNGYDAQFAALLQLVQKGTKVLQTVCNEAKAQRAGPLLSKAPAAKKALERFVFEMKAFFHEAGQPDTFWMGNLKHRDLAGNAVGSQLNPADVDDNSGAEDEDGADDEADEPEQDDEAAEASS